MNIKRFSLCSFVGFIFIFIYEYLIHGVLLVPTYELTPQLWRPMESMQEFMPIMTAVQLLTAAILCFIYTRHHEGKGISEGLRFGAMLGLLIGMLSFSSYAYMPISITLGLSWFGACFVKTIGLGVIFSLLYKNKKT